jgi:hypothetical protein
MADEVFMDIPRVEQMSKTFETFGSILEGVAKALLAISIAMKAAAWISFGATAAVAVMQTVYLMRIRLLKNARIIW